jgi:hypothetical protein
MAGRLGKSKLQVCVVGQVCINGFVCKLYVGDRGFGGEEIACYAGV